MRTPRNETLTNASSRPDASSREDDPTRKCILSREHDSRSQLIRLALAPDGRVLPDVRAKAPGRGAWIGVDRAELIASYNKGRLRGALARAFKTGEFELGDDLPALITSALERNALDRLGLEARGGMLLTGFDRIETAARSGQLHALYHAADSGLDGRAKLAQAWRVGSDREGSALKGLALPVERPILSLALGRENVVHIGLTDRLAAKRVSDALGRWLHFIGPEPQPGSPQDHLREPTAPCETASQGASAHRPDDIRAGASPAATVHEEFE
ncbi:DUF448 domain-containing protein [Microvirga sp. SRT01]|uniref:DUF448 domain-containing protein n=1 Tax=Sphingomonas longa TaxID=2778730 RepID=A0ABS2D912_9SPHN|nr:MULTISPECIES: DUF448 domain-containing protein [Alphaproteobacteria]MBM6577405.1 DUF448 domain-containing protein [Sphingomonas sp. BT552]MBR7710450.1 DUF448 domain-containing protein [Microvirga sp. SRT01]